MNVCTLFYALSLFFRMKLPDLVYFDFCAQNQSAEIRERDWCNVVTCHMDTAQAYVWRLQNFVLGEHILKPCPENPTSVKVIVLFNLLFLLR